MIFGKMFLQCLRIFKIKIKLVIGKNILVSFCGIIKRFKIGKEIVFYRFWYKNNIIYVNDLLNEQGNFIFLDIL